jgi:hypothetical protein
MPPDAGKRIETPASQPATDVRRPQARNGGALQWYVLLSLLIVLGWLLSDYQLVDPKQGAGYWLGIVGGSMMLALLLYPVRKRIRFLHRFGETRHWFRMHMVLGLIGPLLILFHSNYELGSFNSRVAFYCMLLVAGSGLIGRHLYAGIHRGLYGRKTTLKELQQDLDRSITQNEKLAAIMPRLVGRLEHLSKSLRDDAIRQTIGVRRSLAWTFTHSLVRLSLLWTARSELRAAARQSPVVARDRKRLYRIAARYIREFTFLTGRVAQFSLYERLFSLWHVLHLPIFFVMILSALVHVLAVHMY